MAAFDLDWEFTATFVPYRHGDGYVAKGTIFCKEKPVQLFEAHGSTLPELEKAAWLKAQELWKPLKAAKGPKKRTGPKKLAK